MNVESLMTRPAITCHVNDSLDRAASLMWEYDCGALPVVRDDGTLAGMITDRDLCMAAFTQGQPLSAILVNCAMSKHAFSIRAEQHLGDAEALMAELKVRRLPVVDAGNRPIGIISINDLLRDAAQMDDGFKHAMVRVGFTLAAISQPRADTRAA